MYIPVMFISVFNDQNGKLQIFVAKILIDKCTGIHNCYRVTLHAAEIFFRFMTAIYTWYTDLMQKRLLNILQKMEKALAISHSFNTVWNQEDYENEDIPNAVMYGTIRGVVEISRQFRGQVLSDKFIS